MRLLPTAAAALLLLGQPASTAAAQTRVVVADFSGASAGAVRNQAVRGLGGGRDIELVASADWDAAGADAGAAASLGVAAVVEGSIARRGRGWVAHVVVSDPQGNELASHVFAGRNLRQLGAVVRQRIDGRLGDAIRAASAPAALVPERSGASGPPIRVVVRDFPGPGGDRVRGAVVEQLGAQPRLELVPSDEAAATARRLGADLDTSEGRVAVARELRINAYLEGEVERAGRRSHGATLRLVNGLDGMLLEDTAFRGQSAAQLAGQVRSGLWSRLGLGLGSTRPPPPAAGEVRGSDGGDDAFPEARGPAGDASGPGPAPFEAGVSFRILRRTLRYNDDIFGQLRAYELAGAPALGFDARWYPGAHFTDGIAGNLGVELRYEVGLALSSSDSAGTEFPTETSAWSLGARWRIPVGEVEVGALLAYARHHYAIEAANVDNPKPAVPDVDYEALRLGADARVPVVPGLSVHASLAWLHVLDAGEMGSDVWFPRLDVGGLEAGLGVGYLLTDGIEVRAGVDLRRYFYTFNPEPGDPWIAGGAVDQFLAGSIGVAWTPGR